jgi:hypothetical protein
MDSVLFTYKQYVKETLSPRVSCVLVVRVGVKGFAVDALGVLSLVDML